MKTYASAEEYFDDVLRVAARLEQIGNATAAAEVRNGFGCLNGLTDGWVMLVESLNTVVERDGQSLPADLLAELEFVLQGARRSVFRT